MKLHLWLVSLTVFISGYFPLAIIYTIQNISISASIIDFHFTHLYFLIPLWVIMILSVIVTLALLKKFSVTGGRESRIINYSNKSGDLLIYTIPYIIAFLTIDFDDKINIIASAAFMIFLFFMMVKTDKVFVNPFLLLLNYNLYDVNYECGNKNYSGLFLAKNGVIESNKVIQKKKIGGNIFIVTTCNEENNDISTFDC